jgi:E3 ubiquitin-protein ligase DOA10
MLRYYSKRASGVVRLILIRFCLIFYSRRTSLKSWLDTSHRTRCDLCNHVYTYQKVYSTSMPASIPMRVLIGPMFAHIAKWILIALRVLLVSTVWLALLPALLYWCWRVGFWLSDYASVLSILLTRKRVLILCYQVSTDLGKTIPLGSIR